MANFNLENFLPYKLSILSQTISNLVAQEYKNRFGLTMNQWRCIVIISNRKNMSAKDISEYALLDKMSVSRAVKSLMSRHLIVSCCAPDDGRKQLLSLTKQGAKIYADVLPIAQKYEKKLLNSLSESQISNLEAITMQLMQASHELSSEN